MNSVPCDSLVCFCHHKFYASSSPLYRHCWWIRFASRRCSRRLSGWFCSPLCYSSSTPPQGRRSLACRGWWRLWKTPSISCLQTCTHCEYQYFNCHTCLNYNGQLCWLMRGTFQFIMFQTTLTDWIKWWCSGHCFGFVTCRICFYKPCFWPQLLPNRLATSWKRIYQPFLRSCWRLQTEWVLSEYWIDNVPCLLDV